MRMRFWATIRSPAFSISALIAPVRLRAVASGLMIEKVRSIAMISSLKSAGGSCGAYIDAIGERQATSQGARRRRDPRSRGEDYNNFTKMNPLCKGRGDFV